MHVEKLIGARSHLASYIVLTMISLSINTYLYCKNWIVMMTRVCQRFVCLANVSVLCLTRCNCNTRVYITYIVSFTTSTEL